MARPATVISNASTNSSPLPTEFKTSKDESRNSNKSKSMMVTPEELPLPEDMDWPSLVDTATRVMLKVAGNSDSTEAIDRVDDNVGDTSITSA